MPDTFHGKRRLPSRESGARNRDLTPAASRPRRGRLASRISAARRNWIEKVGAVDATTPMWASRRAWLSQIEQWATSQSGQAICSQHHIRPEVVVRVATAIAEFADGATGRNCAASNQSVAAAAGCSESLVTRVRNKLLAPAGFAVEARRGSGGAGRRNRASVWHLIPVAGLSRPRVSDLPTLPPGGGSTYVSYPSPRARKRAEHSTHKRGSGRRRAAPRPLPVQKLAAGLIARSLGLEKVHPGQVCDALTRSGLGLVRSWRPGYVGCPTAPRRANRPRRPHGRRPHPTPQHHPPPPAGGQRWRRCALTWPQRKRCGGLGFRPCKPL